MRVVTSNPNQPGAPIQGIPVGVLERTGDQVDTILKIADHCADTLDQRHEVGAAVEIHPKVETAAVATYEAAHLQLRQILDEQPRWSPEDMESGNLVSELIYENLLRERALRRQQEDLGKPSRKQNPHLRKIVINVNGVPAERWIAWVGGPEPMGNMPHGIGESPARALAKFDVAFKEVLATPRPPPPPEESPAPQISRRKPRKPKN